MCVGTKKLSYIIIILLVLASISVLPMVKCEDTYNAYFTINSGGRLSINGTYYELGTVNFTDQAVDTVYAFTAEAATNYTFSDFTINDVVTPFNPYTVTLTSNATVAANFASTVVDSPTKASNFATIVIAILLGLFIIMPVLLLARRNH